MVSLLFIVLSLLAIALVIGVRNFKALEVVLEYNDFSSPYYSFGISFIKNEHQELYIGLVFINIIFIFHKEEY